MDQANREVGTRFDFKGITASFELAGDVIKLASERDFQLRQMMDILRQKLVKRGVDIGSLDFKDPTTSLSAARQDVGLRQGIDTETAKSMIKALKAAKLKVQAQIQGEQLRVSGKNRDDLQEAIAHLREGDWGLPLKYINFRA